MKKIMTPVLLLTLTGMTRLFAIDVTFTPPKFGGAPPAIVDPINSQLESIFAQYENEIGNTLRFININPAKLINAFASSSVFASTGATQRGYGGYELFAVTVGAMGGFMIPNLFSVFGEINSLLGDVERLNDLRLGFNPQILNAQIGFNTSFLVDKLYLGLKLGYFRLDTGQVAFSTPSIGVTANYQLLPQIRIPTGIILWRGINLGSGLIYQNTNMEIGIPLPSRSEQLNVMGLNITTMRIESKLILEFIKNTLTIPLEAVTSLRLLGFLNLSLGLGADLGFGLTDFRLTGKATAYFDDLPDFLNPIQDPGLSATTGGTNSPDLLNPKLMAGLGFSVGPVIIDIPVTIYPLNSGYNFGITLGFIM
jgi:hypothetical protein